MELIKNLCAYKNQVKQIYLDAFQETPEDTECILAMLDLTQAYGYVEKHTDTLICMVCPVERTLHATDNKQYTIVNLSCLATSKQFTGHHYGLQLMKIVADKLVNEYDSVVWQTNNWEIYKDFDLISCTDKLVCEYIPGLYPTPMLIIWNEPNVDLILDIERACNNDRMGISQTPAQVENMIEMYQKEGLQYLANPCAYLWYDPTTKKIEHVQYSSLAHLTWLMHSIQPVNTFYLFDEEDLHQFKCLKNDGVSIALTKTYKKSKMHFKNIKLNDYLI